MKKQDKDDVVTLFEAIFMIPGKYYLAGLILLFIGMVPVDASGWWLFFLGAILFFIAAIIQSVNAVRRLTNKIIKK